MCVSDLNTWSALRSIHIPEHLFLSADLRKQGPEYLASLKHRGEIDGKYLVSTWYVRRGGDISSSTSIETGIHSNPIGLFLFEMLRELADGNHRRMEFALYFAQAGLTDSAYIPVSFRTWESDLGVPRDQRVRAIIGAGFPDWYTADPSRWISYNFSRYSCIP